MNGESSKLRQAQRTEQEQNLAEQSAQAQGQEFETLEDLLRYDSDQHPVPPEVAQRVNASIAAEPKQTRPWYKALFGRSD